MPDSGPPAAGYADELDLALRLVDVADRISLARFQALDLRVETKPDLTPVSDADRAVERALREVLAHERPEDDVLGEEYGTSAGETTAGGRLRWVIDPIDGTKSFVRGVPVWATLVGVLDGERSVVGAVSAPALGYRWWAAKGLGSWTSRAGAPPSRNRVSAVGELADASLSYSDLAEWADRRVAFESLLDDVWRSRAYGDFWSHVLVAEGAVDVAVEPDLSLWDVAALVPIVEEAGGRVTGVAGDASPGAASVVCTNGLLHDAVLRRLASP
jgi:histidinol-phosphatase